MRMWMWVGLCSQYSRSGPEDWRTLALCIILHCAQRRMYTARHTAKHTAVCRLFGKLNIDSTAFVIVPAELCVDRQRTPNLTVSPQSVFPDDDLCSRYPSRLCATQHLSETIDASAGYT